MMKLSQISKLVLVAGLSVAQAGAAVSAGNVKEEWFGPLSGIMLNVGEKRAIGYFVNENNACNLTLHLADAYVDGKAQATQPVRVNLQIADGSDARVVTAGGKALQFACTKDATAMTILPIDQMAYAASAK